MLPAGAAASVDAITARPTDPRRRAVTSVASAALLLQVVLVYLASAHAKLVSDVWLDLRAVGTIMQLHYATPLGAALARYDQLTRLLTAATLLLETLRPPVALFCAAFPPVRAAIVLLFVLFHLALDMTLYAGPGTGVFFGGINPTQKHASMPSQNTQNAGSSGLWKSTGP